MTTARDVRAGGAYIELFVRDKLQKGLNRAGARMKAFGASIQSVGLRVLGFGTALAAPFALAVNEASKMEETMNKFNVVFGDRSAEVKKWGDDFADQVGRSKQQIADFMAGTQDLLVPLGIDPGAAETMSKRVTELATDLASFNNMQDADSLRDLQAALTGSGEVMKKYGVVLDMAATKQELLNNGIDPKKATNAQKAQARFAIILRGTTAAQGDATRSAGSFANQVKALKASFSDAMVELGTAVLPMVTQFVTWTVAAIKEVAAWIKENQQLVRIGFIVVGVIIAVGAALVAFGTIAGLAGVAVTGFSTAIGIAIAVVKALIAVLAFLVSPVGLVIVAIVAVAAALIYFSGVGGMAVNFLTEKFGQLFAWAKEVFAGIAAAMKTGDIKAAANILWLALQVAWRYGIIQLGTLWEGFKNTSLRVFDELRFGVVKIFAAMLSKIAGLVKSAGDFLGIEELTAAGKALDEFGAEAGKGAQLLIDENAAARQKQTDSNLKKLQTELTKAQAELDTAVASAKEKAAEAENKKAEEVAPPELPDFSGVGSLASDLKDSVRGTFSGAAAGRFGAVSTPLERRATEAAEKTADNTEEMKDKLAEMKPAVFQ